MPTSYSDLGGLRERIYMYRCLDKQLAPGKHDINVSCHYYPYHLFLGNCSKDWETLGDSKHSSELMERLNQELEKINCYCLVLLLKY